LSGNAAGRAGYADGLQEVAAADLRLVRRLDSGWRAVAFVVRRRHESLLEIVETGVEV
jgi:hypothetical protein